MFPITSLGAVVKHKAGLSCEAAKANAMIVDRVFRLMVKASSYSWFPRSLYVEGEEAGIDVRSYCDRTCSDLTRDSRWVQSRSIVIHLSSSSDDEKSANSIVPVYI